MSKIYVDEILPKDNAKISAADLQLPAGSVLQVVQSVASSEVSNTSSSWTSTGFSVTITPKSSTSHFLVRMSLNAYMGYGDTGGVSIYRDGTALVNRTYGFCHLWITTERGTHPLSKEFLDTTSSSESITYTVYTMTQGSTINCPHSPSADNLNTLTVMEIAQ